MIFPMLVTVLPYLGFVHPLLMWVLLGFSLYALYLGIQVRRTYLAEGDLKQTLAKQRFSFQHYRVGSILLALIVIGAVGGITILYLLTGKIPAGSHLFARLGVLAIIATSASLVPFMQKRNWVRYIHPHWLEFNLNEIIRLASSNWNPDCSKASSATLSQFYSKEVR